MEIRVRECIKTIFCIMINLRENYYYRQFLLNRQKEKATLRYSPNNTPLVIMLLKFTKENHQSV